jgi:hypothetical protein
MKLGKLPLGVRERRDDVRVGTVAGAGILGPAGTRPGVADVQEHLLDFA